MSPWQPISTADQEIRILVVHPSQSKNSRIVCTLKRVSIRDDPAYEALSYVWGTEQSQTPILLSGVEHSVTANLHGALRALRHKTKPRALWVDAVCINQGDNQERAAQVAFMGTIYSKAKSVAVWLDVEASMFSRVLFATLSPDEHFDKVPPECAPVADNMWWRRAWTFQEGVLARHLKFFPRSGWPILTLDNLEDYATILMNHTVCPRTCCRRLIGTNDELKDEIFESSRNIISLVKERKPGVLAEGRKFDLLFLATANNFRVASNPRDKLFAFAGLVQEKLPPGFIDYDRPLREWLVHSAKCLITHSHGFDVLSYVTLPNKQDLDRTGQISDHVPWVNRIDALPSWCPDWTQSMADRQREVWLCHHMNRIFMTGARPDTTRTRHISFAHDALICRGIICDKVESVGVGSDDVRGRMWRKWFLDLGDNPNFWQSIRCHHCQQGLWGPRHKCILCNDFNLCSRCVRSASGSGHAFSTVVADTSNLHDRKGDAFRASTTSTVSAFVVPKFPGSEHDVMCDFFNKAPMIRYPFTEQDSLQDAFRKTIFSGHKSFPCRSLQDLFDKYPTLSCKVLRTESFPRLQSLPMTPVPNAADFTELFRWPTPSALFEASESDGLSDSEPESKQRLTQLEQWIHVFAHRRVLIVTAKGYIGLAPEHVKRGDMICSFQRDQIPFVLRPLAGDNAKSASDRLNCTLVGDAYVHGLMEGEAFDALENGDLEETEIAIH